MFINQVENYYLTINVITIKTSNNTIYRHKQHQQRRRQAVQNQSYHHIDHFKDYTQILITITTTTILNMNSNSMD